MRHRGSGPVQMGLHEWPVEIAQSSKSAGKMGREPWMVPGVTRIVSHCWRDLVCPMMGLVTALTTQLSVRNSGACEPVFRRSLLILVCRGSMSAMT